LKEKGRKRQKTEKKGKLIGINFEIGWDDFVILPNEFSN